MTIQSRLQQIQATVADAAERYQRDVHELSVVAISKKRSIDEIREAIACGLSEFGESYLQEALSKIEALSDENLIWHFVGPIQSNKCRLISEHFDWVHSVCRADIVQKLAGSRPADSAPLNVCIQVNISGEASKSGVTCAEIIHLAEQIKQYPQLKCRGLMALPAFSEDFEQQRAAFRLLWIEFNKLQEHTPVDTLSMGMTHDYVAAIAEHATIIRIGTGIFG